MPATSTPFSLATRAAQRGMATILIIVLAGLAITVSSIGMMYGIRGAQEQQMASHASVPAESLAWSGVELVRLYLEGTTTTPVASTTLSFSGISGLEATIVGVLDKQVTVNITATGNLAKTTLQAVYLRTPAKTTTGDGSTGNTDPALQYNGNFNYSGGSLAVTNGTALANVSINGTLTISNGAKALISGCAKDGINLSGGGVADNATLLTEGTFTLSSSSPPNNLTVGAKSIVISQDGGSYLTIKAGAYKANVLSGANVVGSALVGGKRNADNSITPLTDGTLKVTLNDNSVFILDLSKATRSGNTINTSTATRVSGTGTLPANIALTYNAIYGGDVQFKTATVGTLWGQTLALSGWSGTYTNMKANSDVSLMTATIGQFQGGGKLTVQQYNLPTFQSASQLAGTVFKSDGSALGSAINNLSTGVTTAAPGLPGVPYCAITLKTVDVSTLKDQANYIFSFVNNVPMLTIQNVKKADGTLVPAGPYNLQTQDMRTLLGSTFLTCSYGNNTCGKGLTPSTGWNLNGVTAMPPGVLWFDGNVAFDGVQSITRLTNTILSMGSVNLTSSGHVPLYAPNFSGAANLCGGAFYPTNLCNKTVNPPKLVDWTDSAGTVRSGLPIGNIAIEANSSLSTSGWEINGNVILGGTIGTSGATSTIRGGVSMGGNNSSNTSISAGGIVIDVSGVTNDQAITDGKPSTGGETTTTGATASLVWVRPI